ncbi:hypothetical protein LJR034_009356 [Caballeronia sp. LjRoot34]|uniref:hypothetical protein n=1 Tax=Caballeronia sp. LjRoot34 TaxID=3342325 RepID=UPI003ECDFA9B
MIDSDWYVIWVCASIAESVFDMDPDMTGVDVDRLSHDLLFICNTGLEAGDVTAPARSR